MARIVTWLKQVQDDTKRKHKCHPPRVSVTIRPPGSPPTAPGVLRHVPEANVGSIWLCDECGRVWIVTKLNGMFRPQGPNKRWEKCSRIESYFWRSRYQK